MTPRTDNGGGDAIRVVIADDHHLVRSGLRGMLDVHDDLDVVGEAEDGAAALTAARELDPDVVVMDIRMPRMDGIEATRRLREREGGPQVLVLTTFDLDEYVYEALRAGAGGFLLKDAPPERLADAVRTVAAGESLLAPAVTRRLVERFVRRPVPDSSTQERLARLTEREREVLLLVARRGFGWGNLASGAFAVVLSALVFSAFHYLGPYGDRFALSSFTYRAVAGLMLGLGW